MTPRRLLGCATLLACALTAATTVTGPAEPPSPAGAAVSLADAEALPDLQTDQQTRPTRPTPPSTEPPGPEQEPREASIVMGGDLLWHNTVWQSAAADAVTTGRGPYDFDPMFAELKPVIEEADLAICHEEVPFAQPRQAPESYPVFAAPPEVAPWIASMGFDACTTASNHAVDQGFDGLAHTADLLERNGVAHVGTFRTPAERRRPVVLTTPAGVRVGLVAGTYGLNGFPLPEGRPWSVSMWDARNLLGQARAAREAGADIVVVHIHGGNEYDHDPTDEQVALVERLTRSPDVDLVLGDHAHVVQPITRVNGTWVAYGMGNMVAQQETTRPDTYEGVVVRFTFREQPDGRFAVRAAAYVPIAWKVWGAAGPIRVRRVLPALSRATDPAERAWLVGVRDSVRAAVDGRGRTPGLRER